VNVLPLHIPQRLRRFARELTAAGHECHLVGGAVRDMLLGRPLTDYDIATDALPREVMQVFRRVIPTGIKHGTVTVLYRGARFEVTTYRSEEDYSNGRRPDRVRFESSIEQDLARRDFTINGMAVRLPDKALIDPYGGRRDLKARLIRAIGDARERFAEDALRPLRACRFVAQLGFVMDGGTQAAIPESLPRVAGVSAERIRDELVRMVRAEHVVEGFAALRGTGLLELLLPELHACVGVDQRERHCFDVYDHSLYCCAAAPAERLDLRLAALLHDIGKAVTISEGPDGLPRFHNHDRESARLTRAILTRLKFPRATIEKVEHLVLHHMFHYTPDWSDAAVRRFVARVGREHIQDLVALRRADQIGRCNEPGRPGLIPALQRRVAEVLAGEEALDMSDLAIDGNDLMEALQISPGREVGVVLRFLLEAVLDDPAQNHREKLLEMARRFYRERVDPSR
jgi:poly(A) polymerase/tRNA nucleotidyltransferase (CCA-adding enzyme)